MQTLKERFTWTVEEIEARKETGNWHYGLVRDEKIRLVEIFPGLGYCISCPIPIWHSKSWYWVVSDIWKTKKAKT